MPPRRKGYEHFGQTEMHVGVAHDGGDVHDREHDGQPAEETMQVEQPRASNDPLEGASRHGQAPQHRPGQEGPGHDSGGAGDVPGELCAHGSDDAAPRLEGAPIFL